MPKQILKLENFEGGLNDLDDPRDLNINEFSSLTNCTVSKGRIVMAGGPTVFSTTSYPNAAGIIKGYGLFAFSSDYNVAGDNTATDMLVLWDDADTNLYWIADATGTTWAQVSDSIVTSTWNTTSRKPCFYFLDGAFRMSDGGANPEATIWWGYIDRELFSGEGSYSQAAGWFAYLQELKKPTAGNAFGSEKVTHSTGTGGALNLLQSDDLVAGVNVWIRHAKDQFLKLSDPDGTALAEDDWTGDAENNASYQSSQDVVPDHVHEGDTMWRYKFYGTDAGGPDLENATITFRMYSKDALEDQNGDVVNFSYGKSLYLKVYLKNETSKTYWSPEGLTYFGGGYDQYGVGISTNSIRLYPTTGTSWTSTSAGSSYMEWQLPNPYDEDWEPGKYRVLEFSYEDYDALIDGANITDFVVPNDFDIRLYEMHIACNLHGGLINGTMDYSPWIWADPFIGDSGLTFNDPVNNGPREWGASYVYSGNQESGIRKFADKISLREHGLAVGITAYIEDADKPGSDANSAAADYRITGANFYFYDKTDTPYRVAECDFIKGMKSVTASDFPDSDDWGTLNSDDAVYSNTVLLNQIPTFGTYQAFNGHSESEGGGSVVTGFKNFKASFGNASVNGRRLMVGPVYMDTDDGKGTTWHFDRLTGTTPGQYDKFPNVSNNIEVAKSDGDSIVALATYADRLLQFKKNRMHLINITQSTEYLEDTFEGKGVDHPAAVFETDYGITWANNDGCYLYDGEKVLNLIEKKISDSTWSAHFDSNTLVGYHSNSRRIIVTGGGTNNRNAYIFDLNLKSWTYHSNVFSNYAMTNFVKNSDGDLLWGYQVANGMYKWSETALASADLEIMTRDIDFNNPGVRKNIYKVYLTFKGNAAHAQVHYGVDGLAPALTFNSITSGTDGSSTDSGSSAKCIPYDAGTTDWLKAELKPSAAISDASSFRLKISGDGSNAVSADFEINDISVVYRIKKII